MESFSNVDRLAPYGWTRAIADRFTALNQPSIQPGRVVRTDRGSARVFTGEGTRMVTWTRPTPVTGDWAAIEHGHISILLERTSAITRGNASETGNQVLAANVDMVFLVIGLDRRVGLNKLERALALVYGGGATPVVVLLKADTVDTSLIELQHQRASAAVHDATVVVTSAMDGRGCDELATLASNGATVALIGASGIGKSTLGNWLIGRDVLDTGPTRVGDAKGRHTTVTREMLPTASGGVLIDTPGLRGLGLTADHDGLALVFTDIEDLAIHCRFRDCSHETEPGCAVAGTIAPRRLASYRKLIDEQAGSVRRAEFRKRRDKRRGGRRVYNRRAGW